ncbi:uncharacterized protein LOC128092283 [Culex pipiens pallens]|uniref:uncharacterized protein LOC128092283 n=1 Tax=Culex pipiens pallens TaxID=42434 RepID=UPI0022AAC730|nr:uncharacterized protein LOC128092283 [Culex pipiens pallens]
MPCLKQPKPIPNYGPFPAPTSTPSATPEPHSPGDGRRRWRRRSHQPKFVSFGLSTDLMASITACAASQMRMPPQQQQQQQVVAALTTDGSSTVCSSTSQVRPQHVHHSNPAEFQYQWFIKLEYFAPGSDASVDSTPASTAAAAAATIV